MLVVVGGHSRNIGKSSVVAGLIAALPEGNWTAMKITQHGHGICSEAGQACDCAIEYDHPYAVSEESAPSRTDSGRFLAAGARRSFWLRTAVGELGHALPEVNRILAASENAILESNSILNFLRPDVYLQVLDFSVSDMKDSSRRFLGRADGLVVVNGETKTPPWQGIPPRWLANKPVYRASPPNYVSDELIEMVRIALQTSGKLKASQVPRNGSE